LAKDDIGLLIISSFFSLFIAQFMELLSYFAIITKAIFFLKKRKGEDYTLLLLYAFPLAIFRLQ